MVQNREGLGHGETVPDYKFAQYLRVTFLLVKWSTSILPSSEALDDEA